MKWNLHNSPFPYVIIASRLAQVSHAYYGAYFIKKPYTKRFLFPIFRLKLYSVQSKLVFSCIGFFLLFVRPKIWKFIFYR